MVNVLPGFVVPPVVVTVTVRWPVAAALVIVQVWVMRVPSPDTTGADCVMPV